MNADRDAPVLVTGCAGFIGMHATLALLRAGRRVTGVDNLDPYYDVSLKEARLAKLAPRRIPACANGSQPMRGRRPIFSRTAGLVRSSIWRRNPAFAIRSSIPGRTSPTT